MLSPNSLQHLNKLQRPVAGKGFAQRSAERAIVRSPNKRDSAYVARNLSVDTERRLGLSDMSA